MEGIAEKSDDKKQKICFCYVTIRGLFLGFYIILFPFLPIGIREVTRLVFTQLSHKSGFYRDRRWGGQTPSVPYPSPDRLADQAGLANQSAFHLT
jgi:hypothetical protein